MRNVNDALYSAKHFFVLLPSGLEHQRVFFAVIRPEAVGFYLFIVFAAAGGLGVALYIRRVKRQHGQLVCPMGSDCNAVITSRYSKFLGISLEYWGMSYYAIIIGAYIIQISAPYLISNLFLSAVMMLTAAAFFFSLYLLFVQAFLLRQWCIWCLLSAMLSITIFIFSLISLDFAVEFLAGAGAIIGLIRALGFILGMGGATTAMFLFFRFLRDFDIDEGELQTLKGISELVWLGLALILVSQFGSYVVSAEALSQSGLFLAQTIALFVIAVSGAVLMIIFAPLLAAIPFNKTEDGRYSALKPLRKPVFIAGSVVISSWYFAFATNHLPEYGLIILLWAYFAVLAVSVITALLYEERIARTTL